MNKIHHRRYLNSPKWYNIRIKALEYYGKKCCKCEQYATDVHHLDYPEVQGEEEMEDLCVLCRPCHDAIHSAEKGGQGTLHINGLFNYLTDKHKEILSLNLKDSLLFVFFSDTPDGKMIRNESLKLLNVDSYYGLNGSSNLRYRID
jgi:hypothetical protein